MATEPVVIQNMDAGGIALAILDGEAVPAGGMGIAKQLKDEIYQCPPILVLTGRPQDAWLATWSRAEAAVPHPIDPIQLAEAVVAELRSAGGQGTAGSVDPRVRVRRSHAPTVHHEMRNELRCASWRDDLRQARRRPSVTGCSR